MRNDKKTPRSDHAALALEGVGNLSRREFIRLNLALLALAGTSSCSWDHEPRDERSEFRIFRVDDLLALRFELRNLRIEHRLRKPARLVRIRHGEDAFLHVGFPGQHILEQAYPEGENTDPIVLPAKSRIARPSRLVFKIPPDRDPIDLTFDALLDWRDWIPMLPKAGSGGPIAALPAGHSIVELPYGLMLSPNDASRWAHATRPVTHNGRTELWHTRLTSGDPRLPFSVTILQTDDSAGDMGDVETSLTEEVRGQLAGRTAEARTLILSPMGGWLDVRGKWETDPTITRWQHNVTAGQDQRVVIQRKDGFLYPFGQRATLITVTERKLWHAREEDPHHALLRKRNFIVIKKPAMEYEHGKMALSRMTVLDLVTPPLHNTAPTAGPFWIETDVDQPFLFRFRARDWAENRLWLEAPAIFVTEEGGSAQELYESSADSRRIRPLRGQPAAVAKFDTADDDDKDRWGEPLSKPRSVGDTTLHMRHIEFAAAIVTDPVDDAPTFSCRTARMEVRVPSLDQYLNDQQNKGWFELVDPDTPDNLGEIFARAQGPGARRIPMYFDEQADRCGGVAAPSFDVDGLSRVRGPVGDARETGPMFKGGKLDPRTYFNAEHANLLGGFPLAGLLLTDDGTKSPAVPTIKFIMSRKQPSEKAAKKGAKPHWEVGLGLGWSIALQKLGGGIASFVPEIDEKGQSKAKLLIDASVTKTLGKTEKSGSDTDQPEADNAGDDTGAKDGDGREEKPKTPSVEWSVSGKITRFALELETGLGWISIGFEHFGVKLGPPKPKKKNEKENSKDDKEKKEEDDKKDKEKQVASEIDYKMSEIKAKGLLLFLIKLIQITADLPRIPDLSTGEASSVYPAKLPGAGDADINVTVGPIEAPKFKWLKFDVTNVSASVGVGLYFLPRTLKASEPPRVPDNLFTIRIASSDKPLTLTAEPWGGLAHVGFNFTAKGMTGFQGSLGIVYRVQFDLGVTKAKCEGSLAGVFTYLAKDDSEILVKFDLVLKLSGQATIAGFIDIHLALVAVGSRQTHSWSFFAEISVRVQISFFAVSARFRFNYELPDEDGGGDRLRSVAAATPDTGRMAESEWLAYRLAFAQEV